MWVKLHSESWRAWCIAAYSEKRTMHGGRRHLLTLNLLPRPTGLGLWPGGALVRCGVVTLAVALVAGLARGQPADPPRPRLTVAITNTAQLPIDVVGQLIFASTRAFMSTGVDIEWTMPGLPSQWTGVRNARRPSTIVHLVIVSHGAAPSGDGDLLGRTYPNAGAGGGTVVLFNDSITQLAKLSGLSHARVLTVALAHELGHVLLPAPAHAHTGIMLPVWEPWSIVEVATSAQLFTSQKAG
jgi:hypothetical protein